jgi:hypothetical protein
MSELADRFREVEVTTSATAKIQMPSGVPTTWLNAQCSESTVRFIDSQFSAETSAVLPSLFPDALNISIQQMTLRSIFVAIARSGRTQKSELVGEGEAA